MFLYVSSLSLSPVYVQQVDGRSTEAHASAQDVEGIHVFLEQFCVRALLPHLEYQVRTLYQQVIKPLR